VDTKPLLPSKKKNVFEAKYSSDHPDSSGGNPRGTNVAFGSTSARHDTTARLAQNGHILPFDNPR
jgi:hypothetical protein